MNNDEMYFSGKWVLVETSMLVFELMLELSFKWEAAFNFLPCGIVEEYEGGRLTKEMEFDYFPQRKKLYLHITEDSGNTHDVIEHDVELIGPDEACLIFICRSEREGVAEGARIKLRIRRTEPVSAGLPDISGHLPDTTDKPVS